MKDLTVTVRVDHPEEGDVIFTIIDSDGEEHVALVAPGMVATVPIGPTYDTLFGPASRALRRIFR